MNPIKPIIAAAVLAVTATACLPDNGPTNCDKIPNSSSFDNAGTGIIYASPTSLVRVGYQVTVGGPIYADPRCHFPIELRPAS